MNHPNQLLLPKHTFKLLLLLSILLSFIPIIFSSNPLRSPTEQPKSPNINPLEMESEITYSENNYFVISTKDGYLNAYTKSHHPLQLWSISLGKELITTNIISKSIINERKTLIPMDGKLFILTNTPKVQFEEFTIPITELITRAPFSLGFMPHYYFIGNKASSQMTIDVNKGIIVSEKDDVYIGSRINLINVIRLDYTLICLKEKEQIWNTTVSEIIVLADGQQNEMMTSNDNGDTVNHFAEMLELKHNDIFSVHNYNHASNTPVKIYERKNRRPSKDTLLESTTGGEYEDEYNEITDQSQNSFVLNIIQLQHDKNDLMNKQQTLLKMITYVIREYAYLIILIIITTVLWYSYVINNPKQRNDNGKKMMCAPSNNEQKNKNTEDRHAHKNYKENNCDCGDLFNISKKNIKKDFNSSDNIKNVGRRKNLYAEDHRKHQLVTPTMNVNATAEFEIADDPPKDNNNNINEKKSKTRITKYYEESKEDFNNDFNKQSFIMNNSHHTDDSHNILDSDSNNSNPLLTHEQDTSHDNYFEQRRPHANTIDITPIKRMASTTPQQYLTRIDKDFTDFVKIGQGGFGCVLKARHRIDEQIYAVKIIKLKTLDEQTVVKEAKTMTKIHSKHIVEYKTCWFDSSLGSVKEIVQLDEDNDSYYEPSVPKSRSHLKICHTTKKGNDSNSMIHLTKILEKEEEDKEEYNNVIFENDNNKEDNDDVSAQRSKKENAMTKRIFEESISDEEQRNKLSQRLLFHDFRDDSSIGEKSKISKMEMPRYHDTYFFIQMEFCDGLSLNQYIEYHSQSGGLAPLIIYTFTYQLAKSLKKIHNKNIIHRDIKPANIFIYNGNSIKIGDFGLATELNNKSKACISPGKGKGSSKMTTTLDEGCGTPIYLSPEQWEKKPINEKVDIYAMGLVLYEMCACFETSMERRECLKNLKDNRIICEKVLNEYPIQTQLILKMTERNAKNRPSAYEILTSNEFKQWENNLDE